MPRRSLNSVWRLIKEPIGKTADFRDNFVIYQSAAVKSALVEPERSVNVGQHLLSTQLGGNLGRQLLSLPANFIFSHTTSSLRNQCLYSAKESRHIAFFKFIFPITN